MIKITPLPQRGVIAVEGEDRVAFLQGLVSNDVEAAEPGRAVWAALLSPQGKWLADFFILAEANRLLLDCESEQVAMLLQRLGRFRLRMKVALRAESELMVSVAWGGRPDVAGIVAPDPRLPDFAWRILAGSAIGANASPEEWDLFRLQAGVPDGSRDLEADRSTLLEAGFDELGGVSWTKGCYMGQELTARTKYRGLIKRRLAPVAVEGPLPPSGAPVFRGDQEVGTMRSGRGNLGIASLRLDALGGVLRCGEATLTVRVPSWMRLPDSAAARSEA
jgi:folate-binding protein YgfZ